MTLTFPLREASARYLPWLRALGDALRTIELEVSDRYF
jgi:hypothetical protein